MSKYRVDLDDKICTQRININSKYDYLISTVNMVGYVDSGDYMGGRRIIASPEDFSEKFYADQAFYRRRQACGFSLDDYDMKTWYLWDTEVEKKLIGAVNRDNEIIDGKVEGKTIIWQDDIVSSLKFDEIEHVWKMEHFTVHDTDNDCFGRSFCLEDDGRAETNFLYVAHNSETASEYLEDKDDLIMANILIKLSERTVDRYLDWIKKKNADLSKKVDGYRVIDFSKIWTK